MRLLGDDLFDDWDVTVIDVGVSDDVDKLTDLESAYLSEHDKEKAVLKDVPVVRGKHIVASLVEDAVKGVAGDVEGHRVGAWVKMHLMEILKVIEVRHDAAGMRVVLKVIEDSIDLIEFAFWVNRFLGELIAIGFSDGASLIRPTIPNMGMEVMDVVALLLPDPKKLIKAGLEVSSTDGEDWKLFA